MEYNQRLHAAQYRLAQHYLDKLRTAQRAYRQGNESAAHALSLFDQVQEQVKRWQAWAVSQAEEDEQAALLCSAYPEACPDILKLRLIPQEYLGWLEPALMAARRLGDRRAEAVHLLQISEARVQLDAFPLVLDSGQQALHIARLIDDQPLIALGLNLCALAFRMQGQFEQAQEYYEESLVVYRTVGDQQGIALSLSSLGELALQRGDYSVAQGYLEQSLALYRAAGNQRGIAECLNNLGFLALRCEDYVSAVDALEQALDLQRTIGDKGGMVLALSNLAGIAYTQGDVSRALTFSEQGFTIAREIGNRLLQGVNLWLLGQIAMDQGDLLRARDAIEQSLVIGRTTEQTSLILACLSHLTIIDLQVQREDLADKALREASEIACGLPPDMKQLKLYVFIAAAFMWLYRNQPLQAAAWLGLIESLPDPLLKVELKSNVRRLREVCEATLTPEQLAVAREQGKNLDLDSVVAEILSEL